MHQARPKRAVALSTYRQNVDDWTVVLDSALNGARTSQSFGKTCAYTIQILLFSLLLNKFQIRARNNYRPQLGPRGPFHEANIQQFLS